MNSRRLRYALIITLLLLSIVGGIWARVRLEAPYISSMPGHFGSKGCGITKTGTGYAFSWLHVEKGYIVSDTHCIVDLKGFNLAATEFENGTGGFETPVTEQLVVWFNKTFRMNVWRVSLNGYWWNMNVYVPLAHMYYRDWIKQMVRWFEQYGDYVILTFTSYFHNPPCSVYDAQCPAQDQGLRNLRNNPNDPVAQAEQNGLEPAVQMWTDIAQLYANDPAVLYDGLNETCCISAQTWQYEENLIIKTIRTPNPRALIFLGGPDFNNDINPIIQGSVPNFSQPNLVYDFHVYNGYNDGGSCQEPLGYVWQDWPLHADVQVTFAQRHSDAVAFNEWGGCFDFDEYNQKMTSYAQLHHICLVYYMKDYLVYMVAGGYRLTTDGLKVQRAYAKW